jgi:H+/Cl- antiporter ClcA
VIHHFSQITFAFKWLAILVPLAMVVGSASARFLCSLDAVTRVRLDNPWLLFLLPAAGFAIGWIYHHAGKSIESGNNLLLEESHQPTAGIPRRMAPTIMLGTLLTHLFGGPAGREGTALQMGGGIAASFARVLKLNTASIRI